MSEQKYNEIVFEDYPEFRPNLTPREIFQLGSFGGTYWRPITSEITNQTYRDRHKQYPAEWWEGITDRYLITEWDKYDTKVNKYRVKVGTTLEFWESKKWITEYHPYGWVEWYCDFYLGKRCEDDVRQISRWKKTAGPNSRFRRWLLNQIIAKNGQYDDYNISPAIRQTLQHWAYQITQRDLDILKHKSVL